MAKLIWIPHLYLLQTCFVNAKVVWNVTTNPIIINQDVKLVCKSTRFCDNCTTRWSTDKEVLSYFDAVIDPNKYAISMDKEGVTLTIKKLNMDDVNKRYRCSIGFGSFSKNLTLPETFEHHPTKNTSRGSHSSKGKDLQLTYHFEEVHPEPICSVHLDEEDLSSKLKNYKTEIGPCLEVTVKLNHTLKKDQDGGRLRLKCSIGTREEIYYDEYISAKTTNEGNSSWIAVYWYVVVIILTSVYLFAVFVLLQCRAYYKEKNNLKRKDLPEISIKIESTLQSNLEHISPNNKNETEYCSCETAPLENDGSSVSLLDEDKMVNIERLSPSPSIQRINSNSSTESRFNELAKGRYSNIDGLDLNDQLGT